MVGKPSELTYYHAEYLISHHATGLGLTLPIKRLYAVGVSFSPIIISNEPKGEIKSSIPERFKYRFS